MLDILRAANPSRAVTLFGVRLVGLTAENGVKALLTAGLKDAMSLEVIEAFDEAGITIASTAFDIVRFSPVRVVTESREGQ